MLDLFSGIGGFSLGLERAGRFETIGFCEVNDYASKVLRKWWPDVPNVSRGIISLNASLRKAARSSRPGSRARISHSLAQAPALPEPVRDSFGHLCEPFAWFDQGSRSWRTWQRCLLEGWAIFSGTWPRSGMTRNGIAYRRPPLVPLIKEIGSGSLLPTRTASQYGSNKSASSGAAVRPSLSQIARRLPTPTAKGNMMAPSMQKWPAHRNLWPTSTTRDWKDGDAQACRNVPVNGLVGRAVHKWPTPRASDAVKGRRSAEGAARERERRKGPDLPAAAGGSLNPTWVEWLMGFPLEWTALPASETPSSRRASSSSRKRLSRLGA